MRDYSLSDGGKLVRAARNAIELNILSPDFKRESVEKTISEFDLPTGVFITLRHYPTGELRGQIGFPMPKQSLSKLLVEAALAASSEDPRHVPVSHLEFDHLVVEVSLLSKPDRITPKAAAKAKQGKEGLIVQYGFHEGILLPGKDLEKKLDPEEYLAKLCKEAGIPEYSWKDPNAKLYKFTSRTFRESSPREPVEEIV